MTESGAKRYVPFISNTLAAPAFFPHGYIGKSACVQMSVQRRVTLTGATQISSREKWSIIVYILQSTLPRSQISVGPLVLEASFWMNSRRKKKITQPRVVCHFEREKQVFWVGPASLHKDPSRQGYDMNTVPHPERESGWSLLTWAALIGRAT